MQLTVRRKIALALIALFACFTLVLVLTRERYHERILTATFLGFTNTAPGQVKAIIRFPSVHDRAPSPKFFYKPTGYNLSLSIKYLHEDGRSMILEFTERFNPSPGSPFGATDFLIPVYPGTVSIEFAAAQGSLEFFSDNELFGWRPPAPQTRRWKFEMERIATARTNSAGTLEVRRRKKRNSREIRP